MVSDSEQGFFWLVFSRVNAPMIFMQKNACMHYVTETAWASQRSSFQQWLITHGLFFIICITVASGGSQRDLSHVVLGASMVPCTYCSFLQTALAHVSGWSLWDGLAFISPGYRMKQAGSLAGPFFLVPSFARKPEVSQQRFAGGYDCLSGCKPPETQPVAQHFTKEAGALLLFLAHGGLYSLCLHCCSCCSKVYIPLTHKYVGLFSPLTGILWASEIHAEDSNLPGVGISIIVCCW